MIGAREAIVGKAGVILVIAIGFSVYPAPVAAQQHPSPPAFRFPKACLYFKPDLSDQPSSDDLAEERDLSASAAEVYRVWCTPGRYAQELKLKAADRMAVSWKRLWDRGDPFNTAFHETGSFGLLVLIGITQKVPRPMAEDKAFLHDWLEDCSERCFMIYGDDDPGARHEWLRLMQLRRETMVQLGKDPAAKPVIRMLKSAKLYPVN
jgi:hypothetical protein